MHVPAHILQQAMELYLQLAYPEGGPASLQPRVNWVRGLTGEVPLPPAGGMLEQDVANSISSYALRLGQPNYPHMKLVLDPVPQSHNGGGDDRGVPDYILRVDSHDRHLHASAGSPDAAWLESVRMSNKDLGEKIEAAWAAAGLPTFKEYLRRQLETRKQSAARH